MALTSLHPGRLHRVTERLELLGPYGAAPVLERYEVFKPWTPVDEDWRGVQVPITPSFMARAFSWPPTSLQSPHFLTWDDFFERCELAGTVVADGQVAALVGAMPGFALDGELLDIEASFRNRDGSRHLPLAHAVLLGEVLATGAPAKLAFDQGGRTFHHEWTLEAQHDWPQPRELAEQRVWFFPMSSGWCAFQMTCGSLISGLQAESRWLLATLEPGHQSRGELERLLVLLDQAMGRCGITR
ncbi:MAG: hypothetical protein Q8L14_28830 [Myxococcales bacterium]|nr:hypothetical protein [Myxococcales bacterium]